MAEVILSPVIQVVSEALMRWIHEGASGVCGSKQELESLSSTLSTIKSVLDDAEEKQVQEKSVRDWLLKLKFVAYQVDDIVDDYEIHERITEIRRAEARNFLPRLWFCNVGKVCVSVVAKVTFHCSIGHRIRGINEKLTKIAEERSKFHLREGISEKKVEIRETGSFVDESTVFGREDDKQNIIELLLASNGECGRGDVSVIPIVGMGGLGKTTLAQFVYNDWMVKTHFEQLRMWVCVGEDLNIRRVIEMMIESGTGNVCEPLISLDALEQRLGKMLSGRRFLLVLDDVWDEDQHNWERLMHLLRSGAQGSRISKLPDSIGNLKHLRYLNLRGNSFKNFPETTSNLVMLETLNVEYCGELSNLPKGLKYMKRLKHLEMNDFNSIVSMPSGIGSPLSLRTLPLFVVGIENGCAGLEELGFLNKLRGTLSIRKLENVKSFNRFFQTVLHWKNHLHTLEFCWEGGSGKNNAQEKMVLQGLLPHENLKKLSIKNYGGANFPFWMCNPACLPNLLSISLEGCSIVESLPPFGKLQFLKELRISGLNGIKYLSEESYGEGNALQGFPSLKKLTLANMPNLEDWWRSGERYLCGLRELHIENCPKLRALRQLTNLKELTLHSCDVMMTLEHLPSLEHLHISNCTDLMYLPYGLLQDLPTLQSLEILHCHKLAALPVMFQNLTTLRRLRIQNCPMLILQEKRIRHLTALEELMLGALPNITSLPDSLENLTALKKLEICNCPELRSLPEGLKHLHALEELEIKGCPLLTNRCRAGGEDRHKIAHVRRKRIDEEEI